MGGPTGIATDVATSTGNASEDANCQSTSGSSGVANARVGAGIQANAVNSSSSSRSCRDGTGNQTNSSRVVGLNGAAVPVPAPGCGTGAADTLTGLPPLAPIVCNSDDVNGVGETLVQAAQRYGVREGLTVFALEVGGTALTKATTAASESRSEAPTGPLPPDGGPGPDGGGGGDDDDDDDRRGGDAGGGAGGGPGGPGAGAAGPDGRGGDAAQCSDGIDNDGDGRVDFPNDPGCSSAQDDSEGDGGALAFTGMNVLFVVGMGLLLVMVGLRLSAVPRRSRA